VELARGSSHIASTLSPRSLREAVAEVMNEFAKLHGVDNHPGFRKLLADSLERRKNPKAATAVKHFDATAGSLSTSMSETTRSVHGRRKKSQ
jgi:hypothetical protein